MKRKTKKLLHTQCLCTPQPPASAPGQLVMLGSPEETSQWEQRLQMKCLCLKWTATPTPPHSVGLITPGHMQTKSSHLIHTARLLTWKRHARLSSGFLSNGDPWLFIKPHNCTLQADTWKNAQRGMWLVAPEIPCWSFTNHKEKLTNS